MPRLRSLGRPAALGVLLTVTIGAPTPADAHGIGGDASQASAFGFIELGIMHMLTGWDHLAFIAGVLLVARSFRLSVKLISVFVAGHSATLIAATLLGWQVDADYVDAAIAGSVAFVGCVGILGRPRRWVWFAAVVAAFGLVHGLGLATRFADLGLPEDGQLLKVIAFNIGIEIGQATAIFAMVAISAVLMTFVFRSPTEDRRDDAEPDADPSAAFDQTRRPEDSPRAREQLVIQLASAALFIGGAVTSALIALDAVMTQAEPEPVQLADGTSCTIADRAETLPARGGHPNRTFYSPTDATPVNDFGHSVGDGYVIVLYTPDLDAKEVAELRAYVESADAPGVVAGPVSPEAADLLPAGGLGDSTTVTVLHQQDVLTCKNFELGSIQAFAAAWLRPTT